MNIKEQEKILKLCIQKDSDLDQELKKRGYSYDDLVYRHSEKPMFLDDFANYQVLKDFVVEKHEVPVVSFFSGSGGLDLGFEAAGFSHILAIEIEQIFCETMRSNRPHWKIIGPPLHKGDARDRNEISSVLKESGVTAPFEGVFVGGPPCQPFSVAANQRYKKDGKNYKRIGFLNKEHGNLLFDYVWYIKTFLPAAFLIENVPGLLTLDGGEQLNVALRELQKSGYVISGPKLLNASDYGVPQNRQRVFIVGQRVIKNFDFPKPTSKKVPVINALTFNFKKLPNHTTRKHFAKSVKRYMELSFGQRDHLGRIDRLDPYSPAKTVIAGGNKGGGRSHLHPFIPRTLSVRECAHLQTFPDDYVFGGSHARQYTQVGNAVPPLLAFHIAISIYEQIFRNEPIFVSNLDVSQSVKLQ